MMNFAKAPEGKPTLISFDDARTLFHEFGHALHGLLSDVTYPLISGTSVARDFVELPSQLYEHWLEQPEVLRRFALHAETGEPMPEDAAREGARRADLQPGLRHGGIHLLGAGRSRPAPARCGRRSRRAGVRAGRAGADRHARDDRHAPPHAALRAYLLRRRLCLRLLQLPVVGGARRRRLRGIRGGRRHLRSRNGASACTTTSIRPATGAIRPRPTPPSAAACRSTGPLLRKRGLAD